MLNALTADLAPLNRTGQLKGSDVYWTVLIVRVAPYERLTRPSEGGAHLLIFTAPSGEEPPKARD